MGWRNFGDLFLFVIVILWCPAVLRGYKSCSSVMERCRETDLCSLTMDYFNSTCMGPGCINNDPKREICAVAINTFKSTNPDFVNCTCNILEEDFDECWILTKRMFNSFCDEMKSTPKPSADTSTILPTKINCLQSREECYRQSACADTWQEYNRKCDISSNGHCLGKSHRLCRALREDLQTSLFAFCSCDDVINNSSCLAILRRLNEVSCLTEDDPICIPGEGGTTREHSSSPPTETGATVSSATAVDKEMAPTEGFNYGESTCGTAFTTCGKNPLCRNKVRKYVEACQHDNVTGFCSKSSCKKALRDVFDDVPPKLTHAMVFCHCSENDIACEVRRRALNPECAREEAPRPNCLDLKDRCDGDTLCSYNFERLKTECAFRGMDCVSTYASCRAAWVGILGTDVANGCTCSGSGRRMDECLQYTDLVFSNPCLANAKMAYFTGPHVVPPRCGEENFCFIRVENDREPFPVSVNKRIKISQANGCSRDCECSVSRTLVNCEPLPCLEEKICFDSGMQIGHEEVFYPNRGGVCFCLSGVVTCTNSDTSKGTVTYINNSNMYLEVAFSSKEVQLSQPSLVEKFSEVSVRKHLQDVVGVIYAEHSCGLQIQDHKDSMIRFTYEPNYLLSQLCEEQLLQLSRMINQRYPEIKYDVILSYLRAANTGSFKGGPSVRPLHSGVSVFGPSIFLIILTYMVA